MGKRIEYIDVAKAIGILLVILGHYHYTASVPHLGVAIYSFHMPLFFIVSGLFLKPMGVKDGVIKYSKAYIKPYVITGILMLLVTLLLFWLKTVDSGEFIQVLKSIVFSSGSNEDNALFHDIPTVGPVWFLLALFWGCTITSFIKEYSRSTLNKVLLAFALFFTGYMSAKYIRLPLSLQMGMCSVPLIMIGGVIKEKNIVECFGSLSKVVIALMVVIWLFAVITMGDDVNMASCRFREGIVRVPLSIIATIFCLYLCKKYDFKCLSRLKWIGKNTLYVLAGHQLLNFCLKSVAFDYSQIGSILPPIDPIDRISDTSHNCCHIRVGNKETAFVLM